MLSSKAPSTLRLILPWTLLVCLGVAAFELWQDQKKLQKSLTYSQQEVTQITALSIEYQSLGNVIDQSQTRFTDMTQAITWVTNSSQQQGIKVTITRIEGNQIDVRFTQTRFNRLIQWLQQHHTTNLVMVAGEIATANPGKVTGFIRFEER